MADHQEFHSFTQHYKTPTEELRGTPFTKILIANVDPNQFRAIIRALRDQDLTISRSDNRITIKGYNYNTHTQARILREFGQFDKQARFL